MVLLTGLPTLAGGVYWQITSQSAPNVLTIAAPRQAVDDISRSEEMQEQMWTLDLDALRSHTDPQTVRHFPAWAKGQLDATPSQVGAGRLTFEITPEMLQEGTLTASQRFLKTPHSRDPKRAGVVGERR
jgi:hypothetical protein